MVALEDALVDFELVVDEQFEGQELDRSRWLPFYLPQWAGRDRSRAHYRLRDGHLELFIAEDQPPWLPDIEPDLRVSSLQTGCFAGPVGSTVGQHRTNVAMTVVEEQPVERLITPMFGAMEVRARWNPHDDYMVALWMIGFEEEPDQSAEICICEIFGSEATTDTALAGMGIHPFGDPTLTDDFEKIPAPIGISEAHDTRPSGLPKALPSTSTANRQNTRSSHLSTQCSSCLTSTTSVAILTDPPPIPSSLIDSGSTKHRPVAPLVSGPPLGS